MEKYKESVSVGDIVSLNIKYGNEEPENLVVQLVSRNPNIERNDVKEILVTSPVGSSILGKEAGDKCVILNGTVNIEIVSVEKVKVKKI